MYDKKINEPYRCYIVIGSFLVVTGSGTIPNEPGRRGIRFIPCVQKWKRRPTPILGGSDK